MAIEKVVKISVDQVQAAGGLEKFVEGLDNTENKAQSLRTELRQLREQLAQLPEGSDEFNKIAQRAGEVSDTIGDISARVKNLGSDTKNIDAVVQGAQTLAGAFSVASSASALLGEENKDLQEQMLKVEAAMGLTVDIQSIANALQKESALAIGISSAATKIQIGLQTAYATVVGTTTGALKALRVALVTSGVGALVVALGFLISKLTESSDATETLTKEQENLNKQLEFTKELTDDTAKSIDSSTQLALAAAKKRGASEKELTKIVIDGINARIKSNTDEINAIKATQENEFDLTKEQNKRIQDLRKENISLVRNARLEIANFEAEQADKERQDALKREQDKAQKIKEQREKDLEEQKKYNESVKQGLIDLQIATNEAEFEQRNVVIENRKLQEEQLAELGEQSLRREEQEAQNSIEIARITSEAKLAIQNAELDTISNGISFLQSLGIKNKAIQKGLIIAENAAGIAKIVINTVAANAKAVAASPLTGGQPFVTLNTISGSIGVASSIAATVKALSALGGGSVGGSPNSGSIGGGVGGSSTPPNFNIVGQNPNNQLAQSIANRQSQPIEAYVVSGNVSTSQELDRNRISTATFN